MYKVLIVEDEDIIRKGLIFTMDWTKYGCVVAGEAVNGADALVKMRTIHPDIVITDVKMPFKDGIQLLEESIGEFRYEAIIISGYNDFEYARSAIRLGVSDYLLKPVDMDSLGVTLKNTTEKIARKAKMKEYLDRHGPNGFSDSILPNLGSGGRSKYVQDMLDYIRRHFSEKISLSDMSDKMNLSSTYLNIKFKEETNYTFNDFLNRYRILRAVDLLRQEGAKIYEVADSVGFQDYKYFICVFKKYVGCSPTKFMRTVFPSGG